MSCTCSFVIINDVVKDEHSRTFSLHIFKLLGMLGHGGMQILKQKKKIFLKKLLCNLLPITKIISSLFSCIFWGISRVMCLFILSGVDCMAVSHFSLSILSVEFQKASEIYYPQLAALGKYSKENFYLLIGQQRLLLSYFHLFK